MKKNEIKKVKGGYAVLNDQDEINRIIPLIGECLDNCDASIANVLTALCVTTVQMGMEYKVGKPQLLSFISNAWESLERSMENKENPVLDN